MTGQRAGVGEGRAVRYGLLAGALLMVEFIAGMQTFLLRTVIPLVGADLDAHEFYGVMTGAAEIAMFLTLPLGPYLLQRFAVDRLLLHLTLLSVAGGVVAALAPSVGVFVLGRACSGLAAGALASVSLAAIVTVLPTGWRRAVLAGYNVMWVITSFVGPMYAAWVASVLSWRWALVLYLPLLVIARVIIARQLRGTLNPGGEERLAIGSAFILTGGVALLSLVGLQTLPTSVAVAVGGVGIAATLFAARRLLPSGTLTARPGRPAALATMGLLTAAYFGCGAIIAIIVHDLLDGTAREVGVVLAGGGLGWAFAGLAVAKWPAQAARAYVRRSTLGASFLVTGMVATGAVLLIDGITVPVQIVLFGWTLASVGMGLTYLDTINHIVDIPQEVDDVSPAKAAALEILIEAIATATMSTLTAAILGRAIAGGAGHGAAAIALMLTALAAASLACTVRRVVTADTHA
ncbi:MFS transporter [Phytoactinopolyspora mesophila]|uniref:MFS transporter n=1 Tax=Phytoactinopolyspora mesophila TaxID=2650750 RepID=A0A7K3LXG0_9ACTN|nr:MFS transporter [Phytoactinopolyspora mesophila]NDL55719.1 MFS transporter [Phytoactinopolyspora mesophila]